MQYAANATRAPGRAGIIGSVLGIPDRIGVSVEPLIRKKNYQRGLSRADFLKHGCRVSDTLKSSVKDVSAIQSIPSRMLSLWDCSQKNKNPGPSPCPDPEGRGEGREGVLINPLTSATAVPGSQKLRETIERLGVRPPFFEFQREESWNLKQISGRQKPDGSKATKENLKRN